MAHLEIHLEASTREALERLAAILETSVADTAPGATVTVGGTERMEGAARDIFNNAVWVTLVAPIVTGTVVVGLQEAYQATFKQECRVERTEHTIIIVTPDGEITVVLDAAPRGGEGS